MARYTFVNSGRVGVKTIAGNVITIYDDGRLSRATIPNDKIMPLVIYDRQGHREIVYGENIRFNISERVGVITVLRRQESDVGFDFITGGTEERPDVIIENYITRDTLRALSGEFDFPPIPFGGKVLSIGEVNRPWDSVYAHKFISGRREVIWNADTDGQTISLILPSRSGTIPTLQDIKPVTGVFDNPVTSRNGDSRIDYPLVGGDFGDRAWVLRWNPVGRSIILADSQGDMLRILNNPGSPIPDNIVIPSPFGATIQNVVVTNVLDYRVIEFDTPAAPASLAGLYEYLRQITPAGKYTSKSLFASESVFGAYVHAVVRLTSQSLIIGEITEDGNTGSATFNGAVTVEDNILVKGGLDVGGNLVVGRRLDDGEGEDERRDGVSINVAEDGEERTGSDYFFLPGGKKDEGDESDGSGVIATQKFVAVSIADNVSPYATFLAAGQAFPELAVLIDDTQPDVNDNRRYLHRIGHRFIRGCDEWIVAPSDTPNADGTSAEQRQKIQQIRGTVRIFMPASPVSSGTHELDESDGRQWQWGDFCSASMKLKDGDVVTFPIALFDDGELINLGDRHLAASAQRGEETSIRRSGDSSFVVSENRSHGGNTAGLVVGLWGTF